MKSDDWKQEIYGQWVPKVGYTRGDVVEVNEGKGSKYVTRWGIVLGQHGSKYEVLVGLEKHECVVTGETFVVCKKDFESLFHQVKQIANTRYGQPLADFDLASLININVIT